jgi:group I intron endonuclease
MQRSGVYQILCKSNGHRYVGSAEDIDDRWITHKRELRRGKHHNKALQYAWLLFGETGFEFSILEEVSSEELQAKENHYLGTLKPEFNAMTKAGGRSPGREKKIPTCVRLEPAILTKLKDFSKDHKTSMTDVIEEALQGYFKSHGFNTSYTMRATKSAYVIIRQQDDTVEVLDQQPRNGVPLEEIRQNYAARLNSPIKLVIDEGDQK